MSSAAGASQGAWKMPRGSRSARRAFMQERLFMHRIVEGWERGSCVVQKFSVLHRSRSWGVEHTLRPMFCMSDAYSFACWPRCRVESRIGQLITLSCLAPCLCIEAVAYNRSQLSFPVSTVTWPRSTMFSLQTNAPCNGAQGASSMTLGASAGGLSATWSVYRLGTMSVVSRGLM